MLLIEYDGAASGEFELIALINAVEEDDHIPRDREDPAQLRATVERLIPADRATKERTPP